MSKSDISTKEDVILLVDTFYDKVKENKKLDYIFNDVAKIDWQNHLLKCIHFGVILYWENNLLQETQ